MRIFGLIGFPLSHSFSEKYFTEKFRRENIPDAVYRLFPLENANDFPSFLQANPGIAGLNITIPYKEKIIPFLDELDETAKAVGAVNVIQIREDGGKKILEGYNSDVYGFRQSLKPFLTSAHERALILGTGGASKAVEYVLKQIGVQCIFASREKKNIPGKNILTYAEVNEYVLSACRLIVNATPCGMFPDVKSAPPLPYEFITPEHFLYDLIYNPAETEFMKRGKEKGATVMNGMDMLKLQAERAWTIWNPGLNPGF
ncbi:MAG TPA: shikimate dehydrogenase [Bacteroidia bacterium]|nr:shikimate dehydrogenase [Bacteroidia bacterium]